MTKQCLFNPHLSNLQMRIWRADTSEGRGKENLLFVRKIIRLKSTKNISFFNSANFIPRTTANFMAYIFPTLAPFWSIIELLFTDFGWYYFNLSPYATIFLPLSSINEILTSVWHLTLELTLIIYWNDL